MSQSPFDDLFKQYLEDFLAPIGTVERQYEIPGETKYVDVWFRPNLPIQESIDEVVHLPPDHPRRNRILRLLRAWQVRLDISGIRDSVIQEVFMAYPQAFLDMERETETRGKRSLVSRMLQRRFGALPAGVQLAIEGLSYEQVDRLGEALLDFQNLADLQQWIDQLV